MALLYTKKALFVYRTKGVFFNDIRSAPVGVPAKPREARFGGEWAQNG